MTLTCSGDREREGGEVGRLSDRASGNLLFIAPSIPAVPLDEERREGALEVTWLFCVNTRRPWSVINFASNGIIDGGTSSRGALERK